MIRSPSLRYAMVPLPILTSVLLEWALEPFIGPTAAFLLLWPAVVCCAWLGGFGPGLLGTLLAVPAVDYFVIEPRFDFTFHKPEEFPWVFLFVTLGITFSALSEIVHRTMTELTQRTTQLTQAERCKDEFMAVLGHELRSPLSAVRNVAFVLGQSNPRNPELAAMLERQVDQLSRLADDLLDISRIRRGKLQIQKEPVSMANVIDQAAETSQWLLHRHEHELTITLPSEDVQVRGDHGRLVQVIANLLNNAAKYTPKGGQIWLTVEPDGTEVLVSVRDTGIGLDPAMLARVFDLYAQADESPARSGGGLGIGLSLVQRLVELHGGRVEAHSPGLGEGSTFVVRLPILPRRNSGLLYSNGGSAGH